LIREKLELKWAPDSLFLEPIQDSVTVIDISTPLNTSIKDEVQSQTESQSKVNNKEETNPVYNEPQEITEKIKDDEGETAAFPEPKAITLEQAYALYNKNVIFIDARDEGDFLAGHITNAVNIPFDDLDNHQGKLENLPKEKPLVIYCAGTDCDLSILLGNLLFEQEWKNLPEALKNSELIAKQCNVDLKLSEYKFPVYSTPSETSADTQLWNESINGLAKRYQLVTEAAKKRLEMELSVISEMGFSNYFLIVWDIVNEAKRRGMMTIGRGSAANSLTAFCLEITQIDPLEHNLYFERFLNKARSSPPDFDIDFSWKERDEIIKYIFDKYGYENVAMISTTVTFRARSAFREVAKAFGFTNEEISRFSRKIPWTDAANLPNLAKLFPESKGLNFNQEPWKTIVNIASKIARFPRHLSIHPGGIVITPTKITDYVALEYAKNKGLGLIVTQLDMYSIEDLGLIKIDILSQRSLGVLRDTMESIKN